MSEKNKNEAQKYIKKAQEFLDRCEIANIRKWNVEFGIGIFGIIVLIYLGMKSMSDCLWLEYIHISCYGSAGVLLSRILAQILDILIQNQKCFGKLLLNM